MDQESQSEASGFLSDLLVVDLSTEVAGPYASKLFADGGAHVIKVEQGGGDPMRTRSGGRPMDDGAPSALFSFLNAGKDSLKGSPDEPRVATLIDHADLVIESSLTDQAVIDEWRNRNAALVVLSISPWGRTGPWSSRIGNGFTVQAESGAIAIHGHADQEPYQMGGRVVEWSAGTFGAVAALGAVTRAKATGVGEHVDCSLQVASAYISSLSLDSNHVMMDEPPITGPARSIDLPSVEPTSDGWVGIKLYTRAQFENFLVLIERFDLLSDENWPLASYRSAHRAEWNEIVHAWTKHHTTAEIVELATELRIPVTEVNGPADLVRGHFSDSGFLTSGPNGFVQPTPPFKFNGVRPTIKHPLRELADPSSAGVALSDRSPRDPMPRRLPFEGLRVLDTTAMWAGPAVGLIFAYLGAEVIHVESTAHLDGTRMNLPREQLSRVQWWEWSGSWLSKNVNKLGLALAFDTPDGKAVMQQLIATADVIVENFSPRVFENLGFDQEVVRELNPRAVFARMPAFGLSGPLRDRTGFAQTMEQATGMAWMTGPADGPPRTLNGPCDPLAGYHTAFAVMMALAERERSGTGVFIEAAMAESALNVSAELIIEYSTHGRSLMRDANRSPDAAPQGIYPCGEERWLALSIETDAQWLSLVDVMGSPGWSLGSTLATAKGRRLNHDELDACLTRWVAEQDLDDVVSTLVDRLVPAGRVVDPRLLTSHPQLIGVGYYEEVKHAVVGERRLPAAPFRYESVSRWISSPAPTLGQHNHEVLSGIVGLDDGEIRELERRGVIGDWPAGYDRTD